MRARIAYINYTKKLRIYNILNLFCVVYINDIRFNLMRSFRFNLMIAAQKFKVISYTTIYYQGEVNHSSYTVNI